MKEVISRRRSGHTMNAVYCGLDVHKESTYATILNQTGQVVTQSARDHAIKYMCSRRFLTSLKATKYEFIEN